MKRFVRFTSGILFFLSLASPVHAAFSSLYAFGDGACTTTNNTTGSSFYFERRFCNGRVWIEVLAERQGITYESNKNWSFFGHFSPNLVTNVNNFNAPLSDTTNSLFVIWVNNADFVSWLNNVSFNTNLALWTNAMNVSLTNHWKAITNLCLAKGARTLIMPNAVDLTKIPQYSAANGPYKIFVRQRTIDYNKSFSNVLQQARASLPGVKILSPDLFSLLDNLVDHPTNYGFTNATSDAGDAGYTAFNGPGTNFVFWDYTYPSAKAHAHIADLAQQLLSPAQIDSISMLNGSNRLHLVHVPGGRNGIVESSTNFLNWTTEKTIVSTNTTLTIFVSPSGPARSYRLRFPFFWAWP